MTSIELVFPASSVDLKMVGNLCTIQVPRTELLIQCRDVLEERPCSTQEMALLVGKPPRSVVQWPRRGCPARRVGRGYEWLPSQVYAWLRSHQMTSPTSTGNTADNAPLERTK